MYAPQFGLENKPFPLLPAGAEVFVSPQAATLISQMRAACAGDDAIVTVSGPRGVGKTTLVKRALSATGLRRQTVTIDGEPLQSDEVLESLLMLFGFAEPPSGRDAQMATWQEKLGELKAANTHVFIVIENAQATGVDVIEELAALSAADGETAAGARMIILGDENLGELIENSKLLQVQQRISLAHAVAPFSEAEIRGYLKHSLRAAGGEFDAIFEDDCVALFLKLSEGVPRTINAIAEAVIGAACDQKIKPISAKFTADLAARFYDPVADRFDFKTEIARDSASQPAKNNSHESSVQSHHSPQAPDLDALARAIAVAQGDASIASGPANGESDSASWAERSVTLSDTARERTITCGMDSAGEFGMATDVVSPTIVDATGELEDVAQRLSEARTLDDVDDTMAETLFGEELNQIASVVARKKTAAPAANDQSSVAQGKKRSAS